MTTWSRQHHQTLFNADVNFLFNSDIYVDRSQGCTPDFLHDYIRQIAASGVDTYVCNVNAQVPWYPSRAVPHILTGYSRGDTDFVRGHFPPANTTDFPPALLEERCRSVTRSLDCFLDLQEAGVDWVVEISKACRDQGVSPWISVRMNDMHGSNNWSKGFMNAPPQRDVRLRLSGRTIAPKEAPKRQFQTMSYDHRETRDFMFAMIRELIFEYDYEGLELDWMRCPFCCEAPASEATIAAMTAWMKEIRDLSKEKARLTGRPYALGIRGPIRWKQLRNIGLDLHEYGQRGLIDFFTPTNFLQSSWDVPYDRIREALGSAVALYGSLEGVPNWLPVFSPVMDATKHRLTASSPEMLRANAAGKLALGVDGIEYFNFFVADEPRRHPFADKSKRGANYAAIKGSSELSFLRNQAKHYVLATMDGPFMFEAWEFAEQLPVCLAANDRRALYLTMCAEPLKGDLVVQIVVENAEPGALSSADSLYLGIAFNGSWPNFDAAKSDQLLFPCGDLTHHTSKHTAYNFQFSCDLIDEGWNELVLFCRSKISREAARGHHETVKIVSLEVAIKPDARQAVLHGTTSSTT